MVPYKERRRENHECIDCGQKADKLRCPPCYERTLATNRKWWAKHHPSWVASPQACAQCGIQFQPSRKWNLYCSILCRRRKRQATPSEQKYRRIYAYGMRQGEYKWMLEDQQQRCALCREPFPESPQIDHQHDCPKRSTHRGQKDGHGHRQEFGCPECIRGCLCRFCNLIVVRFLEKYPDRRNDTERAYFEGRPIKRYRAGFHLSGH